MASEVKWVIFLAFLYTISARTEEDQLSITSSFVADKTPSIPTSTSKSSYNAVSEKCFYRPVSDCPAPGQLPCKNLTLNNGNSEIHGIICCNLNDSHKLDDILAQANFTAANVAYVHIINSTFEYLDANAVRWRMLKSLAITDGKIKSIKGQFRIMTPIICLNLSNNGLLEMENNSLSRLAQLTILDLSHNNLTHLPAFHIMTGRELWLDISGSDTLLCHDIYQNINKTGENQIVFNRENETVCSSSKTWHWFNATAQVPLKQVRYLSSLQTECPRGENWMCICEFSRLELLKDKLPTFAVSVDCSNRKLMSLPKKLPRNTISLNVSYNNISSLEELNTNPTYNGLREFIADYNYISSINALEGSKFLDSYAFLSLRHNAIKSLSFYILAGNVNDKSFSSNRYGIRFGGNELHCNCDMIKSLKEWVQTRVLDFDEVMCEHVKERVVDLEPSKMCKSPSDWTDYLFYVAVFEGLVFISLLLCFSYDYYNYKTVGRLPWAARKMPRFHCGLLCET
ncbi:protein halfway [Trichogramma pretiosum]|uniref:protein halfway n=1 Tax=Trichogramma pretiosum TaxID=7493 RepID=UPI0006C94CC9|nr:protein halfway [Trichogramma pretiosum]